MRRTLNAGSIAVLHVPEENRCVDLLEVSENAELRQFHEQTIKLYCALCALGNTRVAHALTRLTAACLCARVNTCERVVQFT